MNLKRKERYIWKRRRMKRLANVRAGAIQAASDRKLPEKLEMYAESLLLTMDRNKANRIHKARREAREGKTVSLRSL